VQWLILGYDALGNLTSRADYVNNVTESFVNDQLNRLTSATISTPFSSVKNFTYDRLGNLVTKSDVGNYTYPAPGQLQPHAVMNITSTGMINTTFTYDNNGNQLTGNGRTTNWTSYNNPSRISQGANNWISFLDGPDHQRFQQVSSSGMTTLYFKSFGVHAEYIVGSNTWNEYLTVGNVMVGVRYLNATTEALTTRYFHADQLGSISAITDENGHVVLPQFPSAARRRASGGVSPMIRIFSDRSSTVPALRCAALVRRAARCCPGTRCADRSARGRASRSPSSIRTGRRRRAHCRR
jgi:hypothetical protein